MSGRRWAALPVIVGVLTGNVALAAADVSPAPSPTPEPTDPAPAAETPLGNYYVTTVTTTTTIINAPITVITAPISTTMDTVRNLPGALDRGGIAARERFVINLSGCGRQGRPALRRARRANIRLARNASLVVRVNGKRVTALRLPDGSRRHRRGVALRVRLAPNGMLTIRRPSGRILSVQGCSPA